MNIFIDIKRIECHIAILERELKEVSILLELFTQIKLLDADVTGELCALAIGHIEVLRKQSYYINNRIELLHTITEKFSRYCRSTRDNLDDAIGVLYKFNSGT